MVNTVFIRFMLVVLLGGLCPPMQLLASDVVGEVVFVKGIATAQQEGDAPRVIGKGDKLQQGEKLDTGGKSFALIKLKDGSQMTLRPDTAMVLDKVVVKKGKESALISLVKGGLRAVTGFIGKRRPGDFRLKTPTATIGSRGTDFDARMCDADCGKENATQKAAARPIEQLPVVARASLVRGVVKVKVKGRPDRLLTKGGPLYEGDIVYTTISAFVVLAFTDHTVLTVQSNSTFKVDSFHYQQKKAKAVSKREGTVAFRLIKGGLRMLTGLVGKRTPNNVRITTPVATIGIRGTGVDTSCGAGCVDTSGGPVNLDGIPPGLHTSVWDGDAFIKMPSGVYGIRNGEAFFLEAGTTQPVKMPVIPIFIKDNPAPRPDKLDINFNQLFDTIAMDTSKPGLYVTVREGHITLEQKGKVIDIAGGESGCACISGPDGRPADGPVRLPGTPPFIKDDPYPTPLQFDENVQRIIELINDEAEGLECRL